MHFKVHNGARDVETRTQRAARATHGGLTQYIMNGSRRLVRGRPVVVSEEELKRHLPELVKLEAEGILYATTMDELQVVNLALAAGDLKVEAAVEPPKPVPVVTPSMPLDDAAKDKAVGVPMASNNEPPPPEHFEMPVPAPVAATDTPVAAPLVDAGVGAPVVEPAPETKPEEPEAPKAEEPAPAVEEPAAAPEETAAADDAPAADQGAETAPASPGGKKKKGR